MSYDLTALTVPLTVSHRTIETAEAVSLTFSVPPEQQHRFRFGPGQFLTLFLEINGEVLPRSYSIASSPAGDRDLKVTVKRVAGGKGSNYILDHIKVGDTIRVAPPAGQFYQPPQTEAPRHWLLAAGGSGITPIFSILKTVLLTEPQDRVTLLYANRRADLIIYAKELENWQKRFPDRLEVVHVLSRPTSSWTGLTGRCEGALLDQIMNRFQPAEVSRLEAYLCGPTGFMVTVKNKLKAMGLKPNQIHEENFSSSPIPTAAFATTADDPNRVYIGSGEPESFTSSQVKVLLNGEEIVVTVKPDGLILEALIAQGANPPYSCLEGNCMACVAKVKKGRVYQNDPGILLDENIAAGETLTCQARPASHKITIDYDHL